MKTILVVLLVIGVASAAPLNAPRKNLQDLLTQQNFNTVVQQIQQNQVLYQSLISTYPAQYQSVVQWLASQGYALPRFGVSEVKSLFRDFDFDDLNFEDFLASLNVQELAEIVNIQQYFSSELINQILSYVFQYPNLSGVAINFLGSLNINILELWSELVAGTFNPEQYFTTQTYGLAMFWLMLHQNQALDLAQFYFGFLPIDQTITSLIKTVQYLLSNFANYYLVSTEQQGSLNYQQVYQEFLQNIHVESFFGNFDIQQFFSQDVVYGILTTCFTNPDDAQIPINFLTSIGVNYFNLLGHFLVGTFDPQQYFTVETIFGALQWAGSHQSELPDLVYFLLGYLPIDQVFILLANTLLNLSPVLITIFWPDFYSNIPSFV